MKNAAVVFNPDCRDCSRLSQFLDTVAEQYPDYHSRPVPAFGAKRPRLLIVGLAPGMHGANATGRPFTGDHAGILLYKVLNEYGFSNKSDSVSLSDGLTLKQCRITNAVKCLPPQNKPTAAEINTCNHYLQAELQQLHQSAIILCLGQVSHKAVIKALGLKQADYKFVHGKQYSVADGKTLIDSYHCSRYNTQTRRLTEAMFRDIFATIRKQLSN